jgi:hypothetical protein
LHACPAKRAISASMSPCFAHQDRFGGKITDGRSTVPHYLYLLYVTADSTDDAIGREYRMPPTSVVKSRHYSTACAFRNCMTDTYSSQTLLGPKHF